jgi:hypothetical protein
MLAITMRKTDKNIDNQVRQALTAVCEIALKDINGFLWLTHLANYSQFPTSLKVVCVFDTNENLADFMPRTSRYNLESLIQLKLTEIGIKLKKLSDHISYDTEQNCDQQHNGQWAVRLR